MIPHSARCSKPSDWTSFRLKYVCRFKYGDPLPAEQREDAGPVVVFGSNGPVGRHDRPNTASPVIVVGRKGSFGKLHWSPKPAFCIDTTYFVDEASGDLRWLLHVLSTLGLDEVSQDTGVPGLARESAYEQDVFVPPSETQRVIADFLDRKTAAIDGLIEKKERLIALLQEKRQALITQAVTKGLDPSVPMKDSGIEWLGEIPAHWEMLATRRLCKLTTGGRDTQDAKDEGDYPFFVRSQTVQRIDTYSFEGEAVLTSGDGAGVGKIFHHYVGKLEFHQRVYLYYDFSGVTGRFFFFYLRELLHRVVLAGNAKSTVDSLRRPMLMSFPIAVPPEEEQQAIVAYLDSALRDLTALEERSEESLVLLREYRQALITAAVTGQVDVTEEAA